MNLNPIKFLNLMSNTPEGCIQQTLDCGKLFRTISFFFFFFSRTISMKLKFNEMNYKGEKRDGDEGKTCELGDLIRISTNCNV